MYAMSMPTRLAAVLPSQLACSSGRPSKRQRCIISCAQHVAIIGGGAAGLSAAYHAAEASSSGTFRITLLEKTPEAGKKILISGGTRCNILPRSMDLSTDYFTESSRSALRSIYSRWSLEECEEWLSDPQQIGIKLELEAETGKLFPASNDAREVRDKLLAACVKRGVEFVPGAALVDLQRGAGGGWTCLFENSPPLSVDSVILATGGLSFPKMGTIGTGYTILQRLGHSLCPTYAALTPLLGRHPGPEELPGISIYSTQLSVHHHHHHHENLENTTSGLQKNGKVVVKKAKKKIKKKAHLAERSSLLLTHRGFSGPAAMDLSHHFAKAEARGEPAPTLTASWIKDIDRSGWEAELKISPTGGAAPVAGLLRRRGIPARLADALCAEAGLPEGRKLPDLRKEERTKLLQVLTSCQLQVTGHEGYAKAEVTGGGVPLNEIDCAVMESRIAPGLFVCGELCDVHGRIGGFNFYWAWSSGRLAGLGAAAAC